MESVNGSDSITAADVAALQPWQQRVLAEHSELAERVGKLNVFIANDPAYKALPEYDQMLMVSQCSLMGCYLMLLEERIKRF